MKVKFWYKNWRGETSLRNVEIENLSDSPYKDNIMFSNHETTSEFYDVDIMNTKEYNKITKPTQDGLWFGNTGWHFENQMFIRGFDLDKQEYRDFAVKDIIEFINE